MLGLHLIVLHRSERAALNYLNFVFCLFNPFLANAPIICSHFISHENTKNLFSEGIKKFSMKTDLNPLSANPTEWSNIPKQFVGISLTNCLGVFDHFVGLALKGLSNKIIRV